MTNHSAFQRIALALFLAFAAGCSEAPTDGGGPPELAGTLVFRGPNTKGALGPIHEMNLATGELTTLFDGSQPLRTPEGTTIYVADDLTETSLDGGAHRVIVKKGSDPVRYYDDNFFDPQLSPDGTRIAYGGLESGFAPAVYIVERATGKLVISFTGVFSRPIWLSNEELMASGSIEAPGLRRFRIDPFKITQMDNDLGMLKHASLSPDGKKVAFVLRDQIWTMDTNGRNAKQITSIETPQGSPGLAYPIWSPDGTHIAVYHRVTMLVVPSNGGLVFDMKNLYPSFPSINTQRQFSWR